MKITFLFFVTTFLAVAGFSQVSDSIRFYNPVSPKSIIDAWKHGDDILSKSDIISHTDILIIRRTKPVQTLPFKPEDNRMLPLPQELTQYNKLSKKSAIVVPATSVLLDNRSL